MKSLFIILIISVNILKAQDIEIGFRLEDHGFIKSFGIDKSETDFGFFAFFTELSLGISIFPINNLAVEARIGREFLDNDYTGNNYTILLDYFFLPTWYLFGAYAIHENEGVADGLLKTFGMPGLGVGYEAGKVVSLELTVFKPNEIISSYYTLGEFRSTKIDWLFKFSLCFNWQL